MLKLLIHERSFARVASELKSRSATIQTVMMDDEAQLRTPDGQVFAETFAPNIVYATSDVWFSPCVQPFVQTVLAAPDLQWFQASAAGLEHPILKALGRASQQYTSCHAQSPAIAEWVLWAGLDFFQNGAARRQAQSDALWQRIAFREIADTRWMVYGFGSIGSEVGARLKSLGAHVTGVRRSPVSVATADRMVPPAEARGLLGEMDAVVLCCPLTDETENLADASFFQAMKPESLFVNVGRGGLVDEDALLAALSAGCPQHAALDVVRTEPLPPESPIWGHPSISLSAHISAFTSGSERRTDAFFINNLDRFIRGEALENVIPRHVFEE